jgi:serine/threonine protein phosphatase PrpC
MSIHSISTKGTLKSNEDQHFIHLNTDIDHHSYNPEKVTANIFCICDGHGGKEVADFVCMRVYQYLTKPLIKYPISDKLVRKIFSTIQQQLIDHKDQIAANCGSTCLSVVQFERNAEHFLQIYNLGDCRAVLCRNGIAIPLTKDHKPNWPDERRRILKIGQADIYYDKRGQCWRINDLSVSRSFGDLDNVPYVTHVPDVFNYKLTVDDQFLIIACDGLWDVIDNQTAVNFIIDHSSDKLNQDVYTNATIANTTEVVIDNNVAHSLSEYALTKGSTDNISIIIVFFK